MEKIKLVTDTACDIPLEQAEACGIDIISFLITANGETFRERRDKTDEEFYALLSNCKDNIPTTAGINPFEFQKLYEQYAEEGYTDVICVTINAQGSSTNHSAHMAVDAFYGDHPAYQDTFHIHILDSACYSLGYGFPLLLAAEKIRTGDSAASIVSYLEDYFLHQRTYFCTLSLDFAKKSGRISCAAALVGGLLGIKPVMRIEDSKIVVAGKCRNAKAALVDMLGRTEQEIKSGAPYCLVVGSHQEYAEEFNQLLTEKLGYPASEVFYIGAAVATNAGPDVCGISFYHN